MKPQRAELSEQDLQLLVSSKPMIQQMAAQMRFALGLSDPQIAMILRANARELERG